MLFDDPVISIGYFRVAVVRVGELCAAIGRLPFV
jgi:hypothetical protein